MNERVLSLDISTKTGWAVLVSSPKSFTLEAYGQVPQIHQPDSQYPGSFVEWAYRCFSKIVELIDTYAPDVLVIEETSGGSKNVYSQKILEFIHFLVAKLIKEIEIKAIYIYTEVWRREVGCLMTKEESKHNEYVRKYKKKNKTRVAKDTSGKRIGKLTKKHINIRRANEIFIDYFEGKLRKKDEDLCDALLLGYCYHLRKLRGQV